MKQSWDEYFLNIAEIVATRSTCLSPPKGAVIVIDKSIASTGYNGAPRNVQDCKYDKKECYKRSLGFGTGEGHHICKASHAELNAIVQAARLGIKIQGSTLYCTHKPCLECAKAIINSGISTVVYKHDYNANSEILLREGKVKIKKVEL